MLKLSVYKIPTILFGVVGHDCTKFIKHDPKSFFTKYFLNFSKCLLAGVLTDKVLSTGFTPSTSKVNISSILPYTMTFLIVSMYTINEKKTVVFVRKLKMIHAEITHGSIVYTGQS